MSAQLFQIIVKTLAKDKAEKLLQVKEKKYWTVILTYVFKFGIISGDSFYH